MQNLAGASAGVSLNFLSFEKIYSNQLPFFFFDFINYMTLAKILKKNDE